MDEPERGELLSTSDVGALFDVSRDAVWAWIQNGYVDAERRGRRWFVRRDEVKALQRWIADGNFVWERNQGDEPGPSVLDRRYAPRRARRALQKLDALEQATRALAAAEPDEVEAARSGCRAAHDALWEYDLEAVDDLLDEQGRERIPERLAEAVERIDEIRAELRREAGETEKP